MHADQHGDGLDGTHEEQVRLGLDPPEDGGHEGLVVVQQVGDAEGEADHRQNRAVGPVLLEVVGVAEEQAERGAEHAERNVLQDGERAVVQLRGEVVEEVEFVALEPLSELDAVLDGHIVELEQDDAQHSENDHAVAIIQAGNLGEEVHEERDEPAEEADVIQGMRPVQQSGSGNVEPVLLEKVHVIQELAPEVLQELKHEGKHHLHNDVPPNQIPSLGGDFDR